MKNILKALVLVPLGLIAILFAVANRELVTVSFDPFNTAAPAFALSAPLFLAIILMVMLGVLIGGIATWLSQNHLRVAMRHARTEADQLRRELQDTRLELDLVRRKEPVNTLPALTGRHAA